MILTIYGKHTQANIFFHTYRSFRYIENGSLSTVLKKFGAFSESLVAIYVKQILRGLKYLHEQGALHRDIKGANILTTKDGHVKLADFGVAIKLTEANDTKKKGTIEDAQDVVGSPYWIAPEIIEMATPTAACDIWCVTLGNEALILIGGTESINCFCL